jgi:SNF family Na+-dependent transporter
VFVTSEVSTRSIDLLLVSRKWAVEYPAASPAIQQMIAGRIHLWEETVGAFYFVLLAGHFLASACFAIARWDDDRWNRIVATALIANAVRLAGRIAEGYLGQSWLDTVNNAVYFPAVALIFGTLTVWLWKQARIVREEQQEEILRSV